MIQKRGLRLSSGNPFVSRRRVLVYRYRGLQPSLALATKLEVFPSLLAPSYSWNLSKTDWTRVTSLFPVCPSRSSYQ